MNQWRGAIDAVPQEWGRLIWLDRHPQAAGGELLLVVLGALLWRPRDHRCAGGVDLPGVLVGLLAGHAGDDAAERDLDIVEGVTLAVEDDDLVRREGPKPRASVLVDVG